MVLTEETAAQVESLYRQHLGDAFRGILIFDPVRVERTENQWDEDAFHVTVVYDGDHSLLDPGKPNAISSSMVDRLLELGISNTMLESYVARNEYVRRKELEEEA